jgi:hypothetical protein
MTYAERRALQEGPQPPKQAPRTTPVPERPTKGLTVTCPICGVEPKHRCVSAMYPDSHIARIALEVNQS